MEGIAKCGNGKVVALRDEKESWNWRRAKMQCANKEFDL